MSVYVDDAEKPFRGMVMCHMMADSDEELHTMARRIGVARAYFQGDGKRSHYDLAKTKRILAVRKGAIEVSSRELSEITRKVKNGESTETEHTFWVFASGGDAKNYQ